MAEALIVQSQDSRLAALRHVGMLVAIAASVALGVYVVMWAKTPNYSLLYNDLSSRDVTQVIDALESSGIPYRLDHQAGAVLVPSSEVDDARLKLAGAGLPKSASMGFELLDQEQSFGTSQFMEQARYQRAIEGELSRSIARINTVQNARVHLGLPRQRAFSRQRREPSASVIIDLYPGHRLEPSQVNAITHLVSSSVPNLSPTRVTVVDQLGNLLTNETGDAEMVLTSKRFDYSRKVEQSYVDRIEAILSPLVGHDGVRAQVTADIDFTATEQTRESFNPDLPAIRSERLLEEERIGATAGGIPGALSNEPPGEAIAPEEFAGTEGSGGAAGVAAETAQIGNRRSQTTRNYELDRTISHTKPSVGTIRRLSVAVVVRNQAGAEAAAVDGADADGTAAGGDSEAHIERLTRLVKEAIGFDPLRGDTVSVTSADFLAPPTPEALPEPPVWKQPWVWNVAKQVLGGLFVLLLVFGVLKPSMKSMLNKSNGPAGLLGADGVAALPPGVDGGALEALPGAAQPAQLPGPGTVSGDLDQVKQYVSQEPKVAAQVVRGWVSNNK